MLNMLSLFPTAGRERPEFRHGLRSLPVHPFVAFYTVNAEHEQVAVVRVLHGHLDIEALDF